MTKEEILSEMSVRELQDVIYKKQIQESIDNFSTKKEVEFTISEVETLQADGDGSLFHVRVEDGCEGWESLIEIDRSVRDSDWYGDEEELVKNHIINFIIDNDYYQAGDIEDIIVEKICIYNRPIFKISI